MFRSSQSKYLPIVFGTGFGVSLNKLDIFSYDDYPKKPVLCFDKYKNLSYFNYSTEEYDKIKLTMEDVNPLMCNKLGQYYKSKYNDDEKMVKWYMKAVEKEDATGMFNLGSYYEKKHNYDEMKKYYEMAVEKGDSGAMFNLGYYYQYIEENYIEMMKYYSLAIQQNNYNAMYHLACYYESIEDYERMVKYFKIAFNEGRISSAGIKLSEYYYEIGDKKQSQHYMLKYWLLRDFFNNKW